MEMNHDNALAYLGGQQNYTEPDFELLTKFYGYGTELSAEVLRVRIQIIFKGTVERVFPLTTIGVVLSI